MLADDWRQPCVTRPSRWGPEQVDGVVGAADLELGDDELWETEVLVGHSV
jgi:hypothetical protein